MTNVPTSLLLHRSLPQPPQVLHPLPPAHSLKRLKQTQTFQALHPAIGNERSIPLSLNVSIENDSGKERGGERAKTR